MTNEELKQLQEQYANLLIYQYLAMPKAYDHIRLLVNLALCDGLFLEFEDAFDLDTASGDQLTILGKIVGVPREIYGLDLNDTFFNFTRYVSLPASTGFNRYTTPIDPDVIARWLSNATYVLNDFELRALIQLKIIYNNTFSSFSELKKALYHTFNGSIDILSPDQGNVYFNFTRYNGNPPSIGFNRYTTLSDPDHIERWSQVSIMNLIYTVKQPFYNVMTVAQFLNTVPHSSGVSVTINQI